MNLIEIKISRAITAQAADIKINIARQLKIFLFLIRFNTSSQLPKGVR